MKQTTLGKSLKGNVDVDVIKLLETRLLIQANSGGGKSWALRRLMEITAGQVQHIIIDPEGEFSTLREKFDYIIAAPHDGDALAHPRTAKLLARRLLETGASAICDIYDLKAHERIAFVKLFLDALVNAPKNLWRPVLIVLDEAHIFAPEKGKAESLGAVIDVATRGRKRGQCLIPATQRLAKLHKDVAAECINKLIGRTGLDVDVKRAADELGLTAKEAVQALRSLEPGAFFAFGPAISQTVIKTTVGPVATTHPKAGGRLLAKPPAPSARVKTILAKLGDLPKEAEAEAKTTQELKKEISRLKAELTIATKQRPGISEADCLKRIKAAPATVVSTASSHERELLAIKKIVDKALGKSAPATGSPQTARATTAPADDASIRPGAKKILGALAARYPAKYTRAQVATLTGFSPRGGTFGTYLSNLRVAGFIAGDNSELQATEAGIKELGGEIPEAPKTRDEIMQQWRRALRPGAFRILEVVVDAGEAGISRQDVAELVGMVSTGGTFGTYLSNLNTNGLIKNNAGTLTASDLLLETS
ncbi:MAG: DUF87 domain-containing protein [Gammaproteobacteria bacterium]|nr:DUF87 domain-containing protein [Gammaproteobacteria bacterium]